MNKDHYTLQFNEEFDKGEIDLTKWIPYYLPQWSSREKSIPKYNFEDNHIVLLITEDQQPWCPEFNGNVKVSSLQTGVYSGRKGSKKGQHKFNKECVVREKQINEKKFLPQYGYIEIRAKALDTISNVVALWMIGYEENPKQNAEICIFEIKGCNVTKKSAVIGYGIHKFNDSKLKEEFYEDEISINVTQFHTYAIDWKQDKIDFFIDDSLIRTINQSPDYPMQLMLNIYELPTEQEKIGADLIYPKKFVVDYVRCYSLP